jgi:lipoate-protein ligase B
VLDFRPVLPVDLIDLGHLAYAAAYDRQLALVGERQRGDRGDAIVVVEHPHVITLGRTRGAEQNVLAPDGVEVVAVERGGDVTYHGPGQIVVYPILLLGDGERDLHRFLRNLEAAMIAVLADHGLAADRVPGKTGVWIDAARKIASIGIACRKWVTFHGLALNVNTDLGFFRRINPCGFDAAVMTSMAAELGAEVDQDRVKAGLVRHLAAALGRQLSD